MRADSTISLIAGVGILNWMPWVIIILAASIYGAALLFNKFGSKTDMSPLGKSFIYHCLIIGSIIMSIPFYWMIVTSVKSFHDSLASPPKWLPIRTVAQWSKDGKTYEVLEKRKDKDGVEKYILLPLDLKESDRTVSIKALPAEVSNIRRQLYFKIRNYPEAWYGPKVTTLGRYFWVSIVTSTLTTIGTLLTGALAAFAFAKMNFKGKGLFFYIILATMMVPGQVLLIPSYIILQYLGWLDTYLALIVPWLASVFTIFLMRQFFMTIPDDLWDAAQIDGSGRFRFLFTVVLPLSKPVMITSGIFSFLGQWNSLLWPLIVTTKPEMRTLMVGLQTYNQEAGTDFHLLMAASTMAILPVVIAFFFLQRFFIAGIARTGLK